MKKALMLSVLMLVVSVPVFAQSVWCEQHTFACQFLNDHSFSSGSTYWAFDTGSGTSTVTDRCAWGSATTSAADLDPGDRAVQDVDTQDSYTTWWVQLDLYKDSTSVTSSDFFEITAYNYSTLTGETHYVYANETSGLCLSQRVVNLNNDYSNATVRITVKKGSSATASMYVDNVTFWGDN